MPSGKWGTPPDFRQLRKQALGIRPRNFANGICPGIQARCDLAYDQQNREALVANGSAASIVLREANITPHVTKTGRISLAARLSDYSWLGYRFLFPARRLLRYTITQALGAFVESFRIGRPFQPGYAEARANLALLALARPRRRRHHRIGESEWLAASALANGRWP